MTTDEKKNNIGGIMFVSKETKKKRTFAPNCSLFLLIAVTAITLVALGGCMDKITTNGKKTHEGDDNWPPELDPLVEQQIIQDWYEHFGNELAEINYYCGTYNGYVAFFMLLPDDVQKKVEIAGTTFEYGGDWDIYLWKNIRFHEIVEAYEQGLLTAENIRAISQILDRLVQEN